MENSYWIFRDQTAICANCGVSIKPHTEPTPYCAYCGRHMLNWQDKPCDCFHIEYGRTCCWGTKEVETCGCGGDMRKCDFYDYIRQRANGIVENG